MSQKRKTSKSIIYSERKYWKYPLERTAYFETEIWPNGYFNSSFLKIEESGLLTIKAGYHWDGPSGPTFDSKCAMRASLFHDAIYQLISEDVIEPSYRKYADIMFRKMCIEDGMSRVRAWLWYRSLRVAGKKATKSKILTAP